MDGYSFPLKLFKTSNIGKPWFQEAFDIQDYCWISFLFFVCLALLGLCCGEQAFSSCSTWAWLPCSMWGLGSQTRNPTHVPSIGRWILSCWTAREVPWISFLNMKISVLWNTIFPDREHSSCTWWMTYWLEKCFVFWRIWTHKAIRKLHLNEIPQQYNLLHSVQTLVEFGFHGYCY